jgi:heparan-alpha-glucosaminide N-acetyltransferase
MAQLTIHSPVQPQTVPGEAEARLESSAHGKRIASVDIFRGLNVLLMILVNNLAEVKGLPWWTYHRGDVNGMTYVDMVFPGFLFLMGMAIPLSIDARVVRGERRARIWAHVITRSAGLWVLGLFLANAANVSGRYTGISQTWWTVLGFVAIAMVWVRMPGLDKRPTLGRVVRYAGLGILTVLFVVFRRVSGNGQVGPLDFSYWEILGLLGWAYLLVSAIYLVLGKRFRALVAAFALLVALNVFSLMGWFDWITWPDYWNPFEAGLSSMTLAGVLASFVMVGSTVAATFGEKFRWMVTSAGMLFAVGFALQPLGISKNNDTPTWCLYCTAANLLLVLLLYWIADVKGWRRWASFAKPAGENPLLAYFLPFIPLLLVPLHGLSTLGTEGLWGVCKSVLLTMVVLVVTQLLVRAKISLRL